MSRVIDLFALIVLARLLQPADFGLISIAMSLILIVEALMELPVSQVLLIERDVTRSMMNTAFTLSVLRGMILAIVVGAIAWPFALIYGDPRLWPLISALALAPAFRGVTNPRLALYCRNLDFRRTVATEIFGKAVALVVATATALMTGSYWALAIGTIFSPVASALLSFVVAPYRPSLSLRDWRLFRNFLSWLSGAQLFSAFAWQMDRLVLGRLVSTSIVGRFTMADSLASIPGQVLLGPILGPLSAGLIAVRDDPGRLRRAYLKTLAAVILLGAPVLVGTALLAQPIVSLTLGNNWSSVALILQWLAIAGIPGLLWTPLNALALALGRSALIFNRQLTDFLVKVPLVIAGAWFFLIPGVAVARAIAGLVLAVMAMRAARSAIDVSVRKQLQMLARPAAGCLAMAAVVTPALNLLPRDLTRTWLVLEIGGLALLGMLSFTGTVLALWHVSCRPEGGESMLLEIAHKILSRGRLSPQAKNTSTPADALFVLANIANKTSYDPAAETIYRILDVLMRANIARPVKYPDALNYANNSKVFFICQSCGDTNTISTSSFYDSVSASADLQGFHILPDSIRIAGNCAECLKRS